jgi:glycolate oxidase iron-sulfur subunit
MQTRFDPVQLANPVLAEANAILRNCVHCGFCTATCPTYTLLGDERDSPRGRIYMIKSMLESGGDPAAETIRHVDRCLSCLSCVSTCPSGVDYGHLVDIARARIVDRGKRPLADRLLRRLLLWLLPDHKRFRTILGLSRLGKPFTPLLRRIRATRRLAATLELAPWRLAPAADLKDGEVFAARGLRRGRVALFQGCAQRALAAHINEAAIRLLTRSGIEVRIVADEGCCGALALHMGQTEQARAFARHNIDRWHKEINRCGLDAILITASGCGSVIKDYAHLLARDETYGARAARVAARAKDITEYLASIGPEAGATSGNLKVVWHAPCSLQHGQGINTGPVDLLRKAGFTVSLLPEAHLCCGSAGVYNILEPELADALLQRKIKAVKSTGADIVATANIGCITQISKASAIPVVHIIELLEQVGRDNPSMKYSTHD